jgi:rhamnogalacturonan endolyase
MNNTAYHLRGSLKGRLRLSNGRAASNAAVFLGDDGSPPARSAVDQGAAYYYTAFADSNGTFEITDVREGVYALQAWSNGTGGIGDVNTSFLKSSVRLDRGKETDLGELIWGVSNRTKLLQIGAFDRLTSGFKHGDGPREHALVERCPANLNYVVGTSAPSDWCFAQTHRGNWTISFEISNLPWSSEGSASGRKRGAILVVSLAGYSPGGSATVWVNSKKVGEMARGTNGLRGDGALVRSANQAGEWNYIEFGFEATILKSGLNEVRFEITANRTMSGFMYDAIALEL